LDHPLELFTFTFPTASRRGLLFVSHER